jgi:hypothetical protein
VLVRGPWWKVLAPGRQNGVEYAVGGDAVRWGGEAGVYKIGVIAAQQLYKSRFCAVQKTYKTGVSGAGDLYKSPVCAVQKTYKTGICCVSGQSDGAQWNCKQALHDGHREAQDACRGVVRRQGA